MIEWWWWIKEMGGEGGCEKGKEGCILSIMGGERGDGKGSLEGDMVGKVKGKTGLVKMYNIPLFQGPTEYPKY